MAMAQELPLWLRFCWAAGVGACMLGILLPAGAVKEFVAEISRRGKLKLASDAQKLPRFTVPAHWFTHFYMLGLAVNTYALAFTLSYVKACARPALTHAVQTVKPAEQSQETHYKYAWSTVLLLAMFEAQIARRLYECLCVFSNNPLARMNVGAYFLGLLYYPAASLTLLSRFFEDRSYAESLSAFAWEGRGRVWALHNRSPPFELATTLHQDCREILKFVGRLQWFQWLGLTVFAVGWMQQYWSHLILASLRKPKHRPGSSSLMALSGDQAEANKYDIPRGGWFEMVSCAHYLAEIVIYAGLVVASGCTNLNMWLLFTWVVANLCLVAADTHGWYLQKFEDYPSSRRAIIPFIY